MFTPKHQSINYILLKHWVYTRTLSDNLYYWNTVFTPEHPNDNLYYWNTVLSPKDKLYYWNTVLSAKDKLCYWNTVLSPKGKLYYWNTVLSTKDTLCYWNTVLSPKGKLYYGNTVFTPKHQRINYIIEKLGLYPKFVIHFGLYKLNEKCITGPNPGGQGRIYRIWE